MLCFLFILSRASINTFYSHISTISAETFAKMLTSGDMSFFLNLPGMKPNEYFWQNLEKEFQSGPSMTELDLVKSNVLIFAPTIAAFLGSTIAGVFKTIQINENKQQRETKNEPQEKKKEKCFKTLENENFEPLRDPCVKQIAHKSKWDIDEDEPFFLNNNEKNNNFNVFEKREKVKKIGESFAAAAVIEDAFISKERTSLLVDTRWF